MFLSIKKFSRKNKISPRRFYNRNKNRNGVKNKTILCLFWKFTKFLIKILCLNVLMIICGFHLFSLQIFNIDLIFSFYIIVVILKRDWYLRSLNNDFKFYEPLYQTRPNTSGRWQILLYTSFSNQNILNRYSLTRTLFSLVWYRIVNPFKLRSTTSSRSMFTFV